MKKLGLLIVVFALMLSAGVVTAAEDGNSSDPANCKSLLENAPEVFYFFNNNIGDCVSGLTESQELPAMLCQLDYFRAFYGYESVGDCVSTMRT